LREGKVAESNLDRIWTDIGEERRDANVAKRRKLEALLGREPGQADEVMIEELLTDGEALGELAMNEIAADHPHGGDLLTAKGLQEFASTSGFHASPNDVVRLAPDTKLPCAGEVAAWWMGAEVARALRNQEKLGTEPISNNVLAKLAGTQDKALTTRTPGPAISFALDTETPKRGWFSDRSGRPAGALNWRDYWGTALWPGREGGSSQQPEPIPIGRRCSVRSPPNFSARSRP
jgi:hypothetical protein